MNAVYWLPSQPYPTMSLESLTAFAPHRMPNGESSSRNSFQQDHGRPRARPHHRAIPGTNTSFWYQAFPTIIPLLLTSCTISR